MPVVDYPLTYAYTLLNGGIIAPILPVRLISTDGLRHQDTTALVDSGADVSVFHAVFARAISIDIEAGREETATGVSGDISIYYHRVQIQVDTEIYDLEVGFTDDLHTPENLLGRDWFNQIQLGFRENLREFYLRLEP